MEDPNALTRRWFVGLILRASAAVAGAVGGLVGFTPLPASAGQGPNCIAPAKSISGSCTIAGGLGQCVIQGGTSCVNVCVNNWQCQTNFTGRNARLYCSCYLRICCLVAC